MESKCKNYTDILITPATVNKKYVSFLFMSFSWQFSTITYSFPVHDIMEVELILQNLRQAFPWQFCTLQKYCKGQSLFSKVPNFK
jgi:hypothetical protein